ncbi:hypothetical protein HWV62_18176 [Athelia sp. TMB]|nr:hypothetical protein HWV62_18176 [Athelia sp. TMB]
MVSPTPSTHCKVLVVGGGPAGSYAATALAREGIEVMLFEAAQFPRYHIGESMIPSLRAYAQFIGAEGKIVGHGFCKKPGAAAKFSQFKKEGYTDFTAMGKENYSWNVIRSEFDELLLNHARECGVQVFELTKVNSITYAEGTGKPKSANWTHTPSGDVSPTMGATSFDYIVDATGRMGLISTGHLKNRKFNESLKNIAIWAYWTGTGKYGVGTDRENAPWFEALSGILHHISIDIRDLIFVPADETGWAWFIPLHNGQTSIGVVMNQRALNAKTRAANASETKLSLLARYQSYLPLAPGLLKLIGNGKLVPKSSDLGEPLVRSASDFSYQADRYAGDGYRIAGDAGAFIDPFFSSGVHLAFTSALSAAATIAASLRGDCTEIEAADWHTARFQLVVLSAYKQMRAQHSNVLSDIDDDNFDKAFGFLRSIIQGASEVGRRLSEDEVQRSLEFCVCAIHGPNVPEKNDEVEEGPDGPHPAPSAPLDHQVAENAQSTREVVYQEFRLNNVELEGVNGYSVRLEQGKLGLKKA